MPTERQFKRRHLVYYLPVTDTESGTRCGRLVDITPAGLMLVHDKPFPVGSVYSLTIDFSGVPDLSTQVRVRGRCQWSQPDVNPEYHVAGFEFLDVSEEARDHILEAVEIVGFQD